MTPKPPKERRGLRIVRSSDDDAPEVEYVELTARIALPLRRELKICAAEEGETMAEFVARALEERMARCRKARGK